MKKNYSQEFPQIYSTLRLINYRKRFFFFSISPFLYRLFLIGILLLSNIMFASATDYYVNTSATGANNGTSWTNAFTNLQSALAVATSGDKIYVAKGTYKPSQQYDVSTGNTTTGDARKVTFKIPDGVEVYGGFVGNENPINLNTRNIETNKTILSGDIGTPSDDTDNAYHVVYTKNVSSATIIDGLTFTSGHANVSSPITNRYGAGWYNEGNGASSNPTIRNCTLVHNKVSASGGGIWNEAASSGTANPTLTNCIIANNTSSFDGGGMKNNAKTGGTANPTLTNCIFTNNIASQGGGIRNDASGGTSSPSLINCTFVNNTGGGIYNYDVYGSGTINFTIRNCIFWGNTGGLWANSLFGASSSVNVSYTLVQGSAFPSKTNDNGNNIFNQDPLFVNATNGDLRLQSSSPAIGKADDGNDLGALKTALPNINLKQGATNMASGTGSHDFGATNVGANSGEITFTIENTGNANLNLTSFELNGVDKNEFSTVDFGSTTIASSGSTTFKMKFSPTSAGFKTAFVTISSNASPSQYTFTVVGSGTGSLAFAVTDFVESNQNDGSISNSITITLSGDTFTGTNGNDFASGSTGWVDITGGVTHNGQIESLTVFNGELYAGSDGKVVKWNGSTWMDVMGGATHSNFVRSLIVFNGELYAGSDGKVLKWNGSTWTDIAGGHSGGVYSLAVFNGALYAGSNGKVLKWNGSTWSSVTGGLAHTTIVLSLTEFNGELYAGGIGYVHKWNGSTWSNVTGGVFPAYVFSLAKFNGKLYAASSGDALKWNGSAWSIVGNSTIHSGAIGSLVVFNGNLYAGSSGKVVKWNDSAWTNVAGGAIHSSSVSSLAVFNGNLCAGSNNKVAKWSTAKLGVSNVPIGLTVSATRLSATQLSLKLTGNATNHAPADNINNLTFTFLDGAFTGKCASCISNFTKNNLTVSYTNKKTSVSTNSGSGGSSSSNTVFEPAPIVDQISPVLTTKVSFQVGEYVQFPSNINGTPIYYTIRKGKGVIIGNKLYPQGAGEVQIVAQTKGGGYLPTTHDFSLQIGKGNQTLTTSDLKPISSITQNTPSFKPDFGIEGVKFEILEGQEFVTVDTDGNIVPTGKGVGEVKIKVWKPESDDFNASGSVQMSFLILKAHQSITFDNISNRIFDPNATLVLSATASSGLDVFFEAMTNNVEIQGNTLTIRKGGFVKIKATQVGNQLYHPASEVIRTFFIDKQKQTITFAEINNKVFGDAPFNLVAETSSGLPVSFEILNGENTIQIQDGLVTILKAGFVKIRAFQEGNDSYSSTGSVIQTFTIYPTLALDKVTFNPEDYTLNLTFSKQGNFARSNRFTVQLSDENGEFTRYTNLNTQFDLNTNTLVATIPEQLKSSGQYQVRVVSSSPRLFSNKLPVFIELHPKPRKLSIEPQGTIVCASRELDAYQWYRQNAEGVWEAIEGATERCLDLSSLSGRIEGDAIVVTVAGFIGNRPSDLASPYTYREPTAGVLATESDIVNELQLYPNPTSGQFSIELTLKKVGDVHMKLINASGNEIYPKSFENMPLRFTKSFNLEYFPNGIYFLYIQTPNGTIVRKIVKQ